MEYVAVPKEKVETMLRMYIGNKFSKKARLFYNRVNLANLNIERRRSIGDLPLQSLRDDSLTFYANDAAMTEIDMVMSAKINTQTHLSVITNLLKDASVDFSRETVSDVKNPYIIDCNTLRIIFDTKQNLSKIEEI